jgi:glycosyltransferase involved in cell wall biosynthesis
MLCLEAFAKAVSWDGVPLSQLFVLRFLGDGPLRVELENRVRQLGLAGRVVLEGHVAGLEELRAFYSRAFFSVSPGYVGLSITQSFSFGVPMVIARNEPHAPEIEAAIEGENCVFFTEDSVDDLAKTMAGLYGCMADWASFKRRSSIVEGCRRAYSVDRMADGLIGALLSEGSSEGFSEGSCNE